MLDKKNIDLLTTKFFKYSNIHPFGFDVIISADLNEDYYRLRPDLKGRVKGDLNKFNGTIVQPKRERDDFCILLNQTNCIKTTADGTKAWIGTFAHEATHMNDYKEYLKLSGAKDYDEIRYTSKHNMFFFWTEFHARKIGYLFWQKQKGVKFDDIRLQKITVQEYPFQKNYLSKILKSDASGRKKLYNLCQFLGRYAVWADAYPEHFNQSKSEGLFGGINGQMMDFYRYFTANQNLAEVIKTFPELEKKVMQSLDFKL